MAKDGSFKKWARGESRARSPSPRSTFGATSGATFKLQHFSHKYIHPLGGRKRPHNDTELCLYDGSSSGEGGHDALIFKAVRCGDGFKLKHSSGSYVHPKGGGKNPKNDTKLVFWNSGSSGNGGENALKFQKVSCGSGFKLQHFSGKYVHPLKGKAYPDNNTRLCLHQDDSSGVGGVNALIFYER